MATVQSSVIDRYKQPLWGPIDRALKNCFIVSSILGAAVLIMVFVVPVPPPVPITMDDVPERFARLILQKPSPAVKLPKLVRTIEKPEATPEPVIAKPKPPKRRRTSKPKPTPKFQTRLLP